MNDLSQLFLYIPGVLIFLAGSGQMRRWLRMHRSGACVEASVISCKQVVKKDKKGRELYSYYNVSVEYINPQTQHHERQSVKSPTAFAQAQQITMYHETGSSTPILAEAADESLFHPWIVMTGGALMILLALFENQGKQMQAVICLAIVSAGAGIAMLQRYISLKRRKLQEINAEIIDIYTRQISKETKILKGAKFTYYPVVRYTLDGRENLRRCNVNSERQKAFQTGECIKLYYDPQTKTVLEKRASAGVAVMGAILLIIGFLAGGSILSVVTVHTYVRLCHILRLFGVNCN